MNNLYRGSGISSMGEHLHLLKTAVLQLSYLGSIPRFRSFLKNSFLFKLEC